MPEYLAPGVHADETDGGRRPISGVATGIAGLVGVAERGPTTPSLVTSWAEFQKTFGGFIDRPAFATPYWRLPYAVRGFFENGGKRLYVARVLDATVPAAPEDLAAVVGDSADPKAGTGLSALMAISDISLMAVPDDVVAPAFADALLDRCDVSRDRIAIVNDASGSSDLSVVARHRDTAFGALYYPRLHVPAPHLSLGFAVVPPCGHVAGVLAQTAVASGSPHAAAVLAASGLIADGHPSGVEALDRNLSATEADQLVPHGVNAIRNFRNGGRGVRVWSARTMSSDPQWKYVHVRRLFIFLERSIAQGLQWVVFEPNTLPTWMAVRTAITNFLRERWRDGALLGRTDDEAFFVRCDRSTMTQDDIDNGRLVCMVGVAPVRAAEFVIFRIGQWTADARR
jgi:phage tail sheath protein FI